MEAAKHTVRGRSLRTYRRARTTLICVAIFWLWLLLGAAAFVAGMFDSPTKLFLAMYAGAVAVLVSLPVGLLAAIFMLLNRPAAEDRRPAGERLSSAARSAGSAVTALPWAAAAGRAKELGSRLGPAASGLGTATKAGVGQLRSSARQLRGAGEHFRSHTGRQPDAREHPAVKRLPGAAPGNAPKPPAPRRPPMPPRRPSGTPGGGRSGRDGLDGRGLDDVAS
ncbi:hypothetical protein [Arthrobacter sulfonylureivorans]|uniref:Uncharacterized protein n=1 Tax=Arthrobacter sulfonylureivorans TaxID=2486855 RepID=A0ABY3WFG7_9MICC|nr:hypothetical protein [Arthrobacter sulfonylureivorans]UNK46444.1 hypothetical protein MNQ99_03480 [Arthrobacter sulfonylureivorans]